MRTEPAPSVPTDSGPMPAATAAAVPPDEPPGVLLKSQGLRVMPVSGELVSPLQPNSGVLVLPSSTAPASRSRAVAGASTSQGCFGSTVRLPRNVGQPRVRIRSLIEVGTPSSAPHRRAGAPSALRSRCADGQRLVRRQVAEGIQLRVELVDARQHRARGFHRRDARLRYSCSSSWRCSRQGRWLGSWGFLAVWRGTHTLTNSTDARGRDCPARAVPARQLLQNRSTVPLRRACDAAGTCQEGRSCRSRELLTLAQAQVEAVLASPQDIVAYLAGGLAASFVIGAAFVRTMIPLRWLAVAGNVGFVIFGALHPQYLTLFIAAVLLPINIHRARQMMRLTRRVKAAEAASDLSGLWLRPYMKARKLKKGTVLFRKGDLADHLYCLVDGQIELVEIGVHARAGQDLRRDRLLRARQAPHAHRALRRSACTVLMVDEVTLKQLYYQNPSLRLPPDRPGGGAAVRGRAAHREALQRTATRPCLHSIEDE